MAVLKRIYIKENIIVAVLRKANSHKVDICRLMKINHKKKSRRKTDLNFIFFQAVKLLMRF